jgi:hypothetical protein
MNTSQHSKILQVILWVWFGTITLFTAVDIANVARLESQVKNLKDELNDLEKQHLTLKYHTLTKQYDTHY